MDYRLLGRSGVRVSTLSLGTVFCGTQVAADDGVAIVHAALEAGVNFIDTAEIYTRPSYGAAEEVVGRALQGRRHGVVLATKKRYDPAQFRTGTPADHGLSRHHSVAAAELGLTASQAAIAWTLHQPQVTSVILDASSVAQLQETLPAADARLDPETLCRVAEAVSVTDTPRPAPPQASA